jgi:hypothetical protein
LLATRPAYIAAGTRIVAAATSGAFHRYAIHHAMPRMAPGTTTSFRSNAALRSCAKPSLAATNVTAVNRESPHLNPLAIDLSMTARGPRDFPDWRYSNSLSATTETQYPPARGRLPGQTGALDTLRIGPLGLLSRPVGTGGNACNGNAPSACTASNTKPTEYELYSTHNSAIRISIKSQTSHRKFTYPIQP